MQMIEAVVNPTKVDGVKTALAKIGIVGMTAIESKGHGRQMGQSPRHRGSRMGVGFLPKVVLKVCVPDGQVDAAIKAITEASHTGEVGDGKIFVFPIDKVFRIRTGETDDLARCDLFFIARESSMTEQDPSFIQPAGDLTQELIDLMGDTGVLNEAMGGYRIKVYHAGGFPWDEVFKLLLYRDFKIYVNRHKADIYIEATP